MYIEPNITILKKIMILSSIVLLIVFALVFVFGSSPFDERKSGVVGVSGELTKEDGVFLVNGQTVIRTQQPLDGLVGQSVAAVGTLDAQGILHIEQLVVAPKEESVVEEPGVNGRRATAQSNVSFTFVIPNEWTVRDISSDVSASMVLAKDGNLIELYRAPEAAPVEYAEVESHMIVINGFQYNKKRVILERNSRLSDVIEPSEGCTEDESCPRFWAINRNTSPDTTQAFDSIIASLKFLPEPQGWKLFNVALVGSDWNLKLLYPEELKLTQDSKTFEFTKANIPEIVIEIREDVSGEKDTWGGLAHANIQLPTREETVFTQPDGTQTMILIAPDEVGEVYVAGSGPIFDAVIRTIVFEEK